MVADVCEAFRHHLPSVPACCGSPCDGSIGLGVRFLPNRMWWEGGPCILVGIFAVG